MKLFINAASPFARKVRIVVRELALLEQVEEISVVPLDSAPVLTAANPISQIPALIDDDGIAWTDSTLICQWLDAHYSGRLMPEGEAQWPVKRLEVAACGLIEMNVRMVLEYRRPEQERSPFWLARWEDNLKRGFQVAESICPEPGVLDLATITLVMAATYTEFRYPHIGWRDTCPRIAALQAELEKRQSFIDTYPK